MKTKLFSLISTFCLVATVSVAQITIDSTDMPSIGDTVVMGTDTLPSSGIMVKGLGSQTWDFTSMIVHEFDTSLYVDPSTTPYDTVFPMANLAVEGATNVYQKLDTATFEIIGQAGDDPFGAGLTIAAAYIPTQVLVTLPSSDGATFNDTSGFDQTLSTANLGLPVPNVDSIRLVHTSYVNSIFDAYGDVTTNVATYATIRQLYTEYTEDSVFAYCSDPAGCNVVVAILPFGWSFVPAAVTTVIIGVGNPATATTYKYRWWANGESAPVAEVQTDAVGGTVISASYKLGPNVIAAPGPSTSTLCKDSCDGTATVVGYNGSGAYVYTWNDPMAQTTATATGLCAGTYAVYIVDGTDTSATVSIVVSEPSALSVSVTTIPTIHPDSSTGIATAVVSGGTGSYVYSWDDNGNQATSNALDLPEGAYTLTVTDANGCVGSASGTVNVGIENILANTYIALYPNPVTNELFVKADLRDNASFVVYNISGKQVINVAITNKVNAINTANLANGMYMFQLIDGENTVIQAGKFTVER